MVSDFEDYLIYKVEASTFYCIELVGSTDVRKRALIFIFIRFEYEETVKIKLLRENCLIVIHRKIFF
jgi:hypothetical protein